jgi:nucleotide-binding universal stress UspA family protein
MPLAERQTRTHDATMQTRHEHDGRPPRRILVPVDGDPPTGAAFDHATALAEALQARLLVLGIKHADPVPLGLGVTPQDIATAQKAADELVQARVLEAMARVPHSVQADALYGRAPAGEAIVAAAGEEAADLIVIPMRPGGALAHLLHDGVDRHVLHLSAVPVLVVREPATAPADPPRMHINRIRP